MKTALKLNKKELISLYEKSSEQVKENLRKEFPEEFFVIEKSKPSSKRTILNHFKITGKTKWGWFVNWETLLDLTPILRMLGYACLIWLIS